MSVISHFMTVHHRDCDDIFSSAESKVAEGDWSVAAHAWRTFCDSLEQHFSMEEEVLFPRFEEATGMTSGPTAVMRMEHKQLRAMMEEINQAVAEENRQRFLGLADSLMITLQQHNMKEEQILYPMADQHLPDSQETLDAMQALLPDESEA